MTDEIYIKIKEKDLIETIKNGVNEQKQDIINELTLKIIKQDEIILSEISKAKKQINDYLDNVIIARIENQFSYKLYRNLIRDIIKKEIKLIIEEEEIIENLEKGDIVEIEKD